MVPRDACERAGVPRFRMHDLRRLRVTTLHQQGWTIEEIRRYMGHESCRTTERYLCSFAHARVPARAR